MTGVSDSPVEEERGEELLLEMGEPCSLVDLKLQVPQELYIAYHRCSWIIIHETGRTPLEVMEEMVRDFLVKNGC